MLKARHLAAVLVASLLAACSGSGEFDVGFEPENGGSPDSGGYADEGEDDSKDPTGPLDGGSLPSSDAAVGSDGSATNPPTTPTGSPTGTPTTPPPTPTSTPTATPTTPPVPTTPPPVVPPPVVPPAGDGKFKLMTYNVRFQTAADTGNFTWANRRASVFGIIEANNPDIFGVQEAKNDGIDYPTDFKQHFAATYDVIDPGGGSPKLIFYRRGRFVLSSTLPNAGQKDLSNPTESATCDSNGKGKKAVWGRLRDTQNNKTYVFINTHLAFGNCPKNREAQAVDIKVLVTDVATGYGVIIFGDMNYDPQAKGASAENTVNTFQTRGRDMAKAADYSGTTTAARATFNTNWNGQSDDVNRIDYIFYSGSFSVDSTKIDKALNQFGNSPSDHYPFIANMSPL